MSKLVAAERVPANLPASVAADGRASSLPLLRNYINGAFVDFWGSDEVLEDVDPYTGQVIAYLPRSKSEDVDRAVRAADHAHRVGEWRKSSTQHRAHALERIAHLIEKHLDEFAALESADTGKPITLAKNMDVPRAVDNFIFFAACLRAYSNESTLQNAPVQALHYTHRTPVGVCALIAPWNLPLYLMTWKIAPCLAMGNTCVVKPSEFTSQTLHLLVRLIHEAHILPPGTLNLVMGYGADVGAAMTSHALVSAISFTGGTVTGQRVAIAAAQSFTKVSLELGGKNATIITDSTDFENPEVMATLVRASFANSGQICLCGSRILVQQSIYDKFVPAFVSHVKSLRFGDPRDPQTQVGPVISAPHAEKLEMIVEALRNTGGRVLCGGSRIGYAGFQPTVVEGVDHGLVCDDEFFGPVVTVHPFSNDEDAIQMANASRYGLAGSVWTKEIDRGHKIAQGMETGMVWVNCWLVRDLRVPFGGVKDSGVGREGGQYSLRFFSDEKNICIRL
eukprot:ANDGO_04580.mRNA.1 2-aminomuconic 6-semialdehyde dehydrogenase